MELPTLLSSKAVKPSGSFPKSPAHHMELALKLSLSGLYTLFQ